MRGNNKTEVNLHFLCNSLYLEKTIILFKNKNKTTKQTRKCKTPQALFSGTLEIAMWIRYLSKPF